MLNNDYFMQKNYQKIHMLPWFTWYISLKTGTLCLVVDGSYEFRRNTFYLTEEENWLSLVFLKMPHPMDFMNIITHYRHSPTYRRVMFICKQVFWNSDHIFLLKQFFKGQSGQSTEIYKAQIYWTYYVFLKHCGFLLSTNHLIPLFLR